jgi:hypothetical protein
MVYVQQVLCVDLRIIVQRIAWSVDVFCQLLRRSSVRDSLVACVDCESEVARLTDLSEEMRAAFIVGRLHAVSPSELRSVALDFQQFASIGSSLN